ncbi:hypothetical protein AgCh_026464 [Apium graveolens]
MLYVKCVKGEVYSSKLIHRFSDELKYLRQVKNGEDWVEKGSVEYYKMLLSSDARRLKGMKLGSNSKTSVVFPLEGSGTQNLGNDFGWGKIEFAYLLGKKKELNLLSHCHLNRLHYTWIDIGMPPVSFLVALDTGSDLTWVPCDCLQCAPLSASHYHARDRDLGMYVPSNSSTGKILPCTHKLCDQGPSCKDPKLPCPYNVSYLTENVSSSGLLVQDVIHLLSRKTDASNRYVPSPVIIGCGKTQSGKYLDGIAPDGLLGLGVKQISIPSFLATSGVIQNSFSLCFDENDSGRIYFGDQGPSTQQTTPLLPLNGKFTTYITGVEACCIGDSCLDQTSFKALIDCGSSFTHFPSDVYGIVSKEFDRQINSTRTKYEEGPWEYCYNDSSSRLSKVPSVVLQFGKNNSFVIRTPIFEIYENQDFSGFCLAILPIDSDIGLMGQNYIKGYRMVFDRENLKLGWSPSDCEERMPHSQSPNAAAPNLFSNAGVPNALPADVDGTTSAKSSATRSTAGGVISMLYLEMLLLLLLAFHQLLVCIAEVIRRTLLSAPPRVKKMYILKSI